MAADEHDRALHWQRVWSVKTPETTSWHQRDPGMSLTLIETSGIDPVRPMIDVGAGASPLVDRLIERGYDDLTVLDVAPQGLDRIRARLGEAARKVVWVVADVTTWKPEQRYAIWHDRAVYHFLTDADDQSAYGRTLAAALTPDGQAIIATFAIDGPERCSGLPVQRHDPASLLAALGNDMQVLEARNEVHMTPAGTEQKFMWCRLGMAGGVGSRQ